MCVSFCDGWVTDNVDSGSENTAGLSLTLSRFITYDLSTRENNLSSTMKFFCENCQGCTIPYHTENPPFVPRCAIYMLQNRMRFNNVRRSNRFSERGNTCSDWYSVTLIFPYQWYSITFNSFPDPNAKKYALPPDCYKLSSELFLT